MVGVAEGSLLCVLFAFGDDAITVRLVSTMLFVFLRSTARRKKRAGREEEEQDGEEEGKGGREERTDVKMGQIRSVK